MRTDGRDGKFEGSTRGPRGPKKDYFLPHFLESYIISPKKCPKPVFASPALCDTVETSSALENVQCPRPVVLIDVEYSSTRAVYRI